MSWLLLILSLPTENSTARMRAWRALKACGAAVLRDGVYLLPEGEDRRESLKAVAEDVNRSGGQAYLLESSTDDAGFADLFDRTADYARLSQDLAACLADAPATAAPDLSRMARKMHKACDALTAIDFFPGEARRQVQGQLAALDQALEAKSQAQDGAGEPSPRPSAVQRLDRSAYQARQWATRRRPWVDRLASAWLIRRFIDPQARFLWLADPADCPAEALGFDFDGAAFTHTPEFVSFETLLHSFGLESDPVLAKLARLVHFLDVGGLPVAEAPGIETLLAGMRASLPDDDSLLAAASGAFDYLYAHYETRAHE
ncbi:MAG: chromate resistance protein ChrB domain-containing protein [Pseudomonadota bacterium]